jgi:hypothetical protein
MRSRKILTWGGSLALGGLLFLTLASQARAINLCLPPVHTTWFVTVRIPATGAGPLGDGTVYPGLTFPNGAQSGVFYVDQTQHKLELVFYGPDGITPASAVWQDFTAQVQYNYNYQTEVCTKSDWNLSETPICIAQNATQLGNYPPHGDFYTATISPGHFVEAVMQQNSLSKPILFLRHDGNNTSEMRFYNFETAPIPSSQFNLPANCAP